MKKIGIVEDDEVLCRELQYFLNAHDYEAEMVPIEKCRPQELVESGYHLILMDIGLPETDGMYLCREIRRISDIPIIMITSQNTQMTELLSMNCGADDFVAKPFHTQILLARIEAVLKRVYKDIQADRPVMLGEFVLDIVRGKISSQTESVDLTRNELKILTVLAAKRGQIVSRDEIMNELWDDKIFVDDNTLTVNMTRLKNKLEMIGMKDAIITKRGMGYQLL